MSRNRTQQVMFTAGASGTKAGSGWVIRSRAVLKGAQKGVDPLYVRN